MGEMAYSPVGSVHSLRPEKPVKYPQLSENVRARGTRSPSTCFLLSPAWEEQVLEQQQMSVQLQAFQKSLLATPGAGMGHSVSALRIFRNASACSSAHEYCLELMVSSFLFQSLWSSIIKIPVDLLIP